MVYLVEGSVDVDQAHGVDAQSNDVNGDQGQKSLGDVGLDLGHLEQAGVVCDFEQGHSNGHLEPEQSPWCFESVECPLLFEEWTENN